MDRRMWYLICTLVAALLFFLAIGYDGWQCGSSILSGDCLRAKSLRLTGVLLLTAGLVIFLTGILLVVLIVFDHFWSAIAACVLAVISAVLSIAGVCYFAKFLTLSSPLIATVAMTLTTALSCIHFFELVTMYFSLKNYDSQPSAN
ncbi:hypothetical protein ECG_07281 [Echinococcus granulosus]|uniref:Expressed protein n=1 Tax=Echinococcus granulosus TaxID=6210 RepID=A0A068WW72_ECHGR|nr:hypothetical protein ECG_07281 [Echinococcus granulosus]CDS21950.1 expressed protein [Echinococcus granulosus]